MSVSCGNIACRLEYVRSYLETAPEEQPMEGKALAAATKSMEAISV